MQEPKRSYQSTLGSNRYQLTDDRYKYDIGTQNIDREFNFRVDDFGVNVNRNQNARYEPTCNNPTCIEEKRNLYDRITKLEKRVAEIDTLKEELSVTKSKLENVENLLAINTAKISV